MRAMGIIFLIVTSGFWSGAAQETTGATAGLSLEWVQTKAWQGTQPIQLPSRAVMIGVLAEFGAIGGLNFHIAASRGFGLDGPPLNLTRFDTALLYIFSLGSVHSFLDGGTGLLQFEGSHTQFMRVIGWLGFGLRARALNIITLAFEIKRLALIQLDNPAAPLPQTWGFQLEFLLGF